MDQEIESVRVSLTGCLAAMDRICDDSPPELKPHIAATLCHLQLVVDLWSELERETC